MMNRPLSLTILGRYRMAAAAFGVAVLCGPLADPLESPALPSLILAAILLFLWFRKPAGDRFGGGEA